MNYFKFRLVIYVRDTSGKNGFTLIEVIITITILVMVIYPIYDGIMGSFKLEKTNQEVLKANMLAEKIAQDIALFAPDPVSHDGHTYFSCLKNPHVSEPNCPGNAGGWTYLRCLNNSVQLDIIQPADVNRNRFISKIYNGSTFNVKCEEEAPSNFNRSGYYTLGYIEHNILEIKKNLADPSKNDVIFSAKIRNPPSLTQIYSSTTGLLDTNKISLIFSNNEIIENTPAIKTYFSKISISDEYLIKTTPYVTLNNYYNSVNHDIKDLKVVNSTGTAIDINLYNIGYNPVKDIKRDPYFFAYEKRRDPMSSGYSISDDPNYTSMPIASGYRFNSVNPNYNAYVAARDKNNASYNPYAVQNSIPRVNIYYDSAQNINFTEKCDKNSFLIRDLNNLNITASEDKNKRKYLISIYDLKSNLLCEKTVTLSER